MGALVNDREVRLLLDRCQRLIHKYDRGAWVTLEVHPGQKRGALSYMITTKSDVLANRPKSSEQDAAERLGAKFKARRQNKPRLIGGVAGSLPVAADLFYQGVKLAVCEYEKRYGCPPPPTRRSP